VQMANIMFFYLDFNMYLFYIYKVIYKIW
jgi:hypothetical protein